MFFFAVVLMAALGYLTGRLTDDAPYAPLTVLAVVCWLLSICAVLALGAGWWPRRGAAGR